MPHPPIQRSEKISKIVENYEQDKQQENATVNESDCEGMRHFLVHIIIILHPMKIVETISTTMKIK